jgi:hypothetical protein
MPADPCAPTSAASNVPEVNWHGLGRGQRNCDAIVRGERKDCFRILDNVKRNHKRRSPQQSAIAAAARLASNCRMSSCELPVLHDQHRACGRVKTDVEVREQPNDR